MKRIIVFSATLFAVIFMVSSCKNWFKTDSAVIKVQEEMNVEVVKSFDDPIIDTSLEFTIDSAKLIDNKLFVQISYTGEKSDVSFSLVWNGIFLKSFPPKAIVYINPKINEIKGKKHVIHQLFFNISPILNDANENTIILLKDYKGSLK